MVERHAHLDAAILERHDILHLGVSAQARDTGRPTLRESARYGRAEGRQDSPAGSWVKTTTSQTPPPGSSRRQPGRIGGRHRERRKKILEDGHVVIARRQLGGVCRIGRRGERVVVRRRKKRAVLAVSSICDPFARSGCHRICGLGGVLDCSGDGASSPSGIGRLEYSSSFRPSGLVSVLLNIQCGSSSDESVTDGSGVSGRMRMAAEIRLGVFDRRAAGCRARNMCSSGNFGVRSANSRPLPS